MPAKMLKFFVQFSLGDFDMPRPRPAVAAVVPAISAPSEFVFQVKWCAFRPHAERIATGTVQEKRKGGLAGLAQWHRQDLKKRVAVINGAMSGME
jgi:hypothetical protein